MHTQQVEACDGGEGVAIGGEGELHRREPALDSQPPEIRICWFSLSPQTDEPSLCKILIFCSSWVSFALLQFKIQCIKVSLVMIWFSLCTKWVPGSKRRSSDSAASAFTNEPSHGPVS